MATKISFSVEDARMIKENPDSNFAVLSLDFFASGENLHDMWVSEETLLRTADTIKNCPLVWKYDDKLDDAYTHDAEEVPCGFVPESSEITSRKLPDGRTMLSVVAYVWKRYTGELLNFFKRDGGKKPVSVEMSVLDTEVMSSGMLELKDFRYEGITVLGTFVTPAIPMAGATVLSFSKLKEEYTHDLTEEFADIDMKIPEAVKNNAKRGLELHKQYGRGGTEVGMGTARYLTSNTTVTEEKVRHIAKYFPRHKGDNLNEKNPPSNGYIAWLLWGGTTAWKWSQSIVDRLDKQKEKMSYASNLVTFPYKSTSDMNPALRGISPPITVAQGNEIARQADAIGADKGGWGIAIRHFKDSHKVVDGRWVKREKTGEAKMAAEDMGKGNALKVDKSKEKMSSRPWGSVDKTSLMHKILNASNYKSLVKDVYMLVEAGWEEHPSSSLKYPVMQLIGDTLVYNRYGLSAALQRARQQGESAVASKVSSVYEKMGLNSKQEMAMEDKEMKEEEMGMPMPSVPMAAEPAAEMAEMKPEEEKEEMAADTAKSEETENISEEKAELPAEQKAELRKGVEKEFEMMPMSMEMVKAMAEMLKDEEDEACKMACKECDKGIMASPSVMLSGMYAKACGMAEKEKAYMGELEGLRKFKMDMEAQQKAFEVEKTLAELAEKVQLPSDAKEEMAAEAEKYSFAELEGWRTYCKAKSFEFAMKENGKSDVVKVGMPFSGNAKAKKDDLWS